MTDGTYRPSSRLATKGLLSEPTFRAFQRWDLGKGFQDNLAELRAHNTIGAQSTNWLEDFCKVLARRFGPAGPDASLVELAQRGCDLAVWKPLLLWHASPTDPLLTAFVADWLFGERRRGVVLLSVSAAEGFVSQFLAERFDLRWSPANLSLSAGGLVRAAAEVGLLTAGRTRGFAPFRLHEDTFLYCVHHLVQRAPSTSKLVSDPAWRLYLMTPSAVEDELLRLHQAGRLQFDRAGSLVELRLPYDSAAEFARRMTA